MISFNMKLKVVTIALKKGSYIASTLFTIHIYTNRCSKVQGKSVVARARSRRHNTVHFVVSWRSSCHRLTYWRYPLHDWRLQEGILWHALMKQHTQQQENTHKKWNCTMKILKYVIFLNISWHSLSAAGAIRIGMSDKTDQGKDL